jgi:hypothetical protein
LPIRTAWDRPRGRRIALWRQPAYPFAEQDCAGDAMAVGAEFDAVRAVAVEYLEGMIWGQTGRVTAVFHPKAIQVGHFNGTLEFFSRQEFVDSLQDATVEPVGSPYRAEIQSIEVTGTIAVVRLTDSCFGADFTDYLVMVKDAGRWQIITKAFHVHAHTR